MTRNAMAKIITDQIGRDSLDGIRHIDRTTWWLRKMVSEDLAAEDVPKPEIYG